MPPVKTFGERIADALVEDGLLTAQQVEELLEQQKKEGTRLLKLILEKAYVSEQDMAVSMGRVLNTPPINLARLSIPLEVADLVPREMAHNHKVVPVSRLENKLFLAMADPLNVLAIDDVRRITRLEVATLIASEKAILDKLNHIDASKSGSMEDIIQDAQKKGDADAEADSVEVSKEAVEEVNLDQLAASSEEAPVVKLANLILVQAVKDRASDVHIEPFEKTLRLRYRIDGVLMDATPPPKQMQLALVSRFKIMSSLDIAERRLPQDGRMRIRVGGKDYDLRVSIMPTVHGEKVVLRLLDKSNLSASIDKLGLDPDTLPAIQSRRGCAARIDSRHRPDRFRQDDDAVFRAQRTQQPDLQYRDGRRPGRVPGSRHQPGADEEGNRAYLRQRAPLDFAPGPRHHHDRRDSRHRNGRNRHRSRADRPPGPEHHAL